MRASLAATEGERDRFRGLYEGVGSGASDAQTKAAELLHMSFRSFRYYAKKYNLVHREEMYGDESGSEASDTPA